MPAFQHFWKTQKRYICATLAILGIIIALVFALVTLLVGMPSLPILSLKACWHGLLNGGRTGFRSGVIVGVFCMLLFGFGYGIRQGLTYGLSDGLFVGLFVGLPSGLIAGLHYEQNSLQMRHIKSGQKRSFSDRLLDGLNIGLCAGLIFGIIDGLLHVGLDLTAIYASIVGLCGGIAFGFGGGTNLIPGLGREIKPAETVVWSWHHVRRNLAGNMRKGLLIGLVVMISVSMMIGCASSLFYGPGYGLRYGLVYGFIVGFVVGVAGILAGMLNSGWSSDVLAEHQQFRPNEGTMRSARNAVFAACLFGPIGGIASGLAGGSAFGLVGRLDGWLILGVGFAITLGIIFALEFTMIHGGIAWIEHYVLRWYLWHAGYIPWNYAGFLDYAAERILLRKVGGGYMFAHRLLLDYFSSLNISGEDA